MLSVLKKYSYGVVCVKKKYSYGVVCVKKYSYDVGCANTWILIMLNVIKKKYSYGVVCVKKSIHTVLSVLK